MSELNIIIESIAPKSVIQINSKYAPWIDSDTLYAIKHKSELYQTATSTYTPEDWRAFRHYRNITKKLINNKKRCYYEKKLARKDKSQLIKDNPNYPSQSSHSLQPSQSLQHNASYEHLI